ncbi:winged helix-turn-helix transcriptional regulator [Neorhizobium alkalisoli]|uniref:HxlR family transcriptional regulator n=1 Tax=Neorhizobium alkalisoli TaxID=528178 RepID=A0A561QNH8_9HYPH|nr:HxlR family transcriptional regulator [Neorhizobium alkalisoli]
MSDRRQKAEATRRTQNIPAAMREEKDERPTGARLASDRLLLDEIASKWSILVLGALCHGPLRFNQLKRELDGVTQKALTQCLRRLERDGILSRTVLPTSPVSVEYGITPLGRTLEAPFKALADWTVKHGEDVGTARTRYDAGSK